MKIHVVIYECGKCQNFTSIERDKEIKYCAVCGEFWGDNNMHVGGTGTIKNIVENG